MPRLPRVYIEDSVYYITCKGLPNQTIFKDKEDYKMYFGLLKKYVEQYQVKLYAYNLMPEHLHLLMEVDDKTAISQIMHALTSSYTKYYNGRYERSGHLFRERFKAAIVEKNANTLLSLTAYIHLNPKRLNLALAAEAYPYSSYALYLDAQGESYGLVIKEQISQVLAMISGEGYGDFVKKVEVSEEFKKMHRQIQRKGMFGSAEFMERVKDAIEKHKEEQIETQESGEPEAKTGSRFNSATAIFILVICAAGVYLYLDYSRNISLRQKPVVSAIELKNEIKDLDNTEWQIQLSDSNGILINDVISFDKGKISSANLSAKAYPVSNYSLLRENDKIIWETIQTQEQGTATWRGEVSQAQMRGILSLQQADGTLQDFTFKSVKYRKK